MKNITRFFRIKRFKPLILSFMIVFTLIIGYHSYAQNSGDYRSLVSGDWSASSTWERFNGSAWIASPPAPSSSDETITIRNGHNVIISEAITADQVVVGAGGTLTQNADLILANGAGDDLTVNGTWNYLGSSLGSPGNALIGVGGTLNFTTANNKFVAANITNNGTMNWQDGEIYFSNNPTITNNGTWIISGNNNMSTNNTQGSVVNTGTINKTSEGTTTVQTASFSNFGTINFNAGTLASNSDALINAGNLTGNSGTFNNTGTLNANTGSVINGTGNFNNDGTFNVNINQVLPVTLVFGNSGTIDGPGNLTINSDCTFSGNFTGAGSMFLNGNTTWTTGTIGRSTFSAVGKTFNFTTADNKFVAGNITNNGTMNWQDGEIYFSNNPTITNNGTWIISGNNNMLTNNTQGSVVNTGTINKTSAGTTTVQTASFSNLGTINFNAGTLASNSDAFNTNAGSVINGTGIFNNTGTVNLNVDQEFPATLVFGNFGTVDGPGNLTINNDFTFSGVFSGAGSIFLNGNATWAGGSNGRSTFTAVGTSFNFTTADNKFVDANITNNGTMNWQDGEIYFSNNPTITNNGTWIISGNNNMSTNNTQGSIINNGIINKTSAGISAVQTASFSNFGTINFNAGTLASNSDALINTGNLTSNSGTFTNTGTLNANAGSVINGTGNFNNAGTFNLNVNQVLPVTLVFGNSGTIDGPGNLTINSDCTFSGNFTGAGSMFLNGNTTWTTGTIGRSTFSAVGKTFNFTTADNKFVAGNITNNGTMNWQDGEIYFSNNPTITNNGTWIISGNNNMSTNNTQGSVVNTGTINKTGAGITMMETASFANNNGAIIKGLGTYTMNSSAFSNNGIIAPGLSPGILTINGNQPFSANSTLQIELLDGLPAGTGFDQFKRDEDLTLAGTLTVTETGIVPNGTYTIISLTSGTVSGSFATTNFPANYTLQVNASNVQVIKSDPAIRNLNLTLLLEGLYESNSTMRKSKQANGFQFPGVIADQVTVELHSSSNYETTVFTSGYLNLSTSGSIATAVPASLNGSYYITIKNRNSIATTTAAPVAFNSGAIDYNFDGPVKAYGGNLQLMAGGVYTIYSGDVTQDGTVDTSDMTPVDNDASSFMIGYVATDVNGDGTVDTGDMTIIDNNASAFVSSVTPQ